MTTKQKTRQEEIREGIERKIQLGIDFGFSPAEITKEVQEYEDSCGVVLKVEGELPNISCGGDYDCYESCHVIAQEDMLKAGYIKTERLI